MSFNIYIAGVGGSGILTLSKIIADAAVAEGNDVTTLEFHGLAQRYGSLSCQVKIGKKVYSPMILGGEADLIMGLEPMEAVRALYYSSKERTTVLTDTYKMTPLSLSLKRGEYPPLNRLLTTLRKHSKEVVTVKSAESTKKLTGETMMSNTYLLGSACGRGMLPLKTDTVLKTLLSTVPKKYISQNRKVFQAAVKSQSHRLISLT